MQQIQQGRTTTGAVQTAQLDTTTGANAAAKGIQTTSALAMPLLQRLDGFSGKMLAQGTQKMVTDAKKQAVIDVQDGTFGEYGLGGSSSVYDMAYDGAAETAYVSKTNTDTQQNANIIAAKNKYNPAGFMTAWESQKREISSGSKKVSPYVDAVTADVADQYGKAAYAKIASNLATIQYETMKKDNSLALAMYEQEFLSAKINGNEDAAMTALINRNKTFASMKETFQVSDRGISALNVIFEKSVVKAQVQSNFRTANDEGNSVEFIANFRDTVEKDKAFETMTPTDINGMIDDMYKTIKGQNAYEADVVKAEKAKYDATNEDVIETFNDGILSGTLTQENIDMALEAKVIDIDQYKKYSLKVNDTGATFTNTGTELRVVSNLAAISKDDIMNLSDMTNEDKMKYIGKLEAYQNSEEGKWTSTVQGRASLTLLKNKYNIIGSSMLADLTSEEDAQAYAEIYQAFILEMETLPPEQRESRAMHYAQAAIDVQEAARVEAELTDSNNTKSTQAGRVQKRILSYQRQIGETKSQAYVQGLSEFQDNFGQTGDIDFSIRKEWR